MDRNYLLIILVVLVVAVALMLIWRRRDRALPPAPGAETEIVQIETAAGLVDPVTGIPPEAVGASSFVTHPVEAAEPPPAAGPPDELTRLKGLGPKAAAQLNALGIARYDQLAALSGPALARIDAQMGAFQGRIVRDRWVEQAGHLAAGDTAGFEAKFGKLGG